MNTRYVVLKYSNSDSDKKRYIPRTLGNLSVKVSPLYPRADDVIANTACSTTCRMGEIHLRLILRWLVLGL